ncbi:hypothetical protein C8T65DRAFT_738565 [Cerioporus squamosus]|nr:hypothetical protein C8T65DRAFT_738565 [Cerioporus squamosus]
MSQDDFDSSVTPGPGDEEEERAPRRAFVVYNGTDESDSAVCDITAGERALSRGSPAYEDDSDSSIPPEPGVEERALREGRLVYDDEDEDEDEEGTPTDNAGGRERVAHLTPQRKLIRTVGEGGSSRGQVARSAFREARPTLFYNGQDHELR